MGGGRRGGGVEVQWTRHFLPEQSSPPTHLTPPPRLSLVCTGCYSGDTAAGFGPDCRNISSVVESGIAGKDNEREGDGEWEGGGLEGRKEKEALLLRT